MTSSIRKPRLSTPSTPLPQSHLSHIHSISFDYYGRRFATSSADRTIHIWDLHTPSGTWSSNHHEWIAGKGPVRRVCWSHPEFGQLVASGGEDMTVTVWEEREGGFKSLATPGGGNEDTNMATNNSNTTSEGASRWVQKATLSDARRPITALEFAPRHLGLRLATGSADGVVRVYEALDTMNLNHWKLDGVIEESPESTETHHHGQNNSMMGGGEERSGGSQENMGVSSLSWCTGRFEPATLCVGFSSGRASVYRYDDGARSWVEAVRLPNHCTPNGVPRGVLDVAWAPNVGRSYHLIATCGKDNRLKVHRIKRGRGGKGEEQGASSGAVAASKLVYEGTVELDKSEVWRCQWNLTGTVLASSGDCGVVKLWKSDFQGRWKCVSEIVGDSSGVAAASALRKS